MLNQKKSLQQNPVSGMEGTLVIRVLSILWPFCALSSQSLTAPYSSYSALISWPIKACMWNYTVIDWDSERHVQKDLYESISNATSSIIQGTEICYCSGLRNFSLGKN